MWTSITESSNWVNNYLTLYFHDMSIQCKVMILNHTFVNLAFPAFQREIITTSDLKGIIAFGLWVALTSWRSQVWEIQALSTTMAKKQCCWQHHIYINCHWHIQCSALSNLALMNQPALSKWAAPCLLTGPQLSRYSGTCPSCTYKWPSCWTMTEWLSALHMQQNLFATWTKPKKSSHSLMSVLVVPTNCLTA